MIDIDKLVFLWVLILGLMTVMLAGEIFLRCRKQKEETLPTVTVADDMASYIDSLPPGLAVILAWSEPGNDPVQHKQMQEIVRSQMPTLGQALDRMVETKS